MLRFIIRYYEENGELAKTLDAARRLTLLKPQTSMNYLLLARACFVQNKKQEFYEAANQAIDSEVLPFGKPSSRSQFSAWKDDPSFKS